MPIYCKEAVPSLPTSADSAGFFLVEPFLQDDYHNRPLLDKIPMNELDLDMAVGEICQACDGKTGKQSPFFLIVGAGISAPTLPLAVEIEAECKTVALKYKRVLGPPGRNPIDTYSHWFSSAFAHAEQRQQYLRLKMLDKPISPAVFRLAHLLLHGAIGNLVITPNFDDFLSRALHLFGIYPIVCDHPNTIGRISLDSDDVQIVHVHGTYWYYDCCNLREEIEKRENFRVGPHSIPSFLDSLLWSRSAIVVGYSGWEGDVIMSALKRRLTMRMRFDLYWFCYKHSDYDLLPEWIKESPNIRFVFPKPAPEQERPLTDSIKISANIPEELPLESDKRVSQTLPAQKIFDDLVRTFKLAPPLFTSKPLQFFAEQLKKSIFLDASGQDEPDIFSLENVVERVQRAAEWEEDEAKRASFVDMQIEQIRNAIRQSAYKEALVAIGAIKLSTVSIKQKKNLFQLAFSASSGLGDNSTDELDGYLLVCAIAQQLAAKDVLSRTAFPAWARALINKGVLQGRLRSQVEALATYDEAIRLFGDSTEGELREATSKALFNKGVCLRALHRDDEALAAYNDLIRRFSDSAEIALREQVAMGLMNMGIFLGFLQRSEEALAAYDEIIRRFHDSAEDSLRMQVGKALFNKAIRLSAMKRSDEELATYDELIRQFGDSSDTFLRELVGRALFNKGLRLGTLKRGEEALAALEAMIERCGESTDDALCEQMARALFTKGLRLSVLERNEEALTTYDDLMRRFGDSTQVEIHRQVSRALIAKGILLGKMDRTDEELGIYDDLMRRFGDSTDADVRKQVARALFNRGFRLGVLQRSDEALATYDDLMWRFGDSPEADLREQVAKALFNKGSNLARLQRTDEQLAVYDDLVRRFGDSTEATVRERVARSLLNKGICLYTLQRTEEALAAYDDLISRFEDSFELDLCEYVAKAMLNRGACLSSLKRIEEEIAAYTGLLERFGSSTQHSVSIVVAKAIINKGECRGALGHSDEELAAFDDVVRKFGDSGDSELRVEVARALSGKGVRLRALQRSEEELAAYDELIGRFEDATENVLRECVARVFFDKGSSLSALRRFEEAVGAFDKVVLCFVKKNEAQLEKLAAEALLQKGITLEALGRSDQVASIVGDFNRLFERDRDPEIEQWRKKIEELRDQPSAHGCAKPGTLGDIHDKVKIKGKRSPPPHLAGFTPEALMPM